MNTPATDKPPLPLSVILRRVVMLSAVCGFVEVIGYGDLKHIYPAIMTGNTVQLGLSLEAHNWITVILTSSALACFFCGSLIASVIKRHMKRPPLALLLSAVLYLIIGVIREFEPLRNTIELPIFAFALALQGVLISSFGGVSAQTIVVTGNIVKFGDALVGYFKPGNAKRASAKEVLVPGAGWAAYCSCAALGAFSKDMHMVHFLFPAALLVLSTIDLIKTPDHG